jgi:rSAM/selenodomain-associated transferase 1
MGYYLLDPSQRDPALAAKCALAIMAKAPRPGKVKTRLSPPLTLDESAALNVCFLRDTAQNLSDVAHRGLADGMVCHTPVGDEALFDGLLPDGFRMIPQRGEGFGERLLAAAQDILACGYGAVCLIDSDSPTVPAAAFQQAVTELSRSGDRVVLGASDDGGYYLIGLKAPHAEPFTDISWSTPTVYAETLAALQCASIDLVKLPTWYDVDDGATLQVLTNELLHGKSPEFAKLSGYPAPHSREFLQQRARATP